MEYRQSVKKSTKHKTIVVNQNLEHFDDISLKELFGRINFFLHNKIWLFFIMKHSLNTCFNPSFSFEWVIVV
jgi:hypothetical protein